MNDIAAKEAEARALGLSYGQLVAREWAQQEARLPSRPTTRAARSREARPDRPCLVCGRIMQHARPDKKYCCDDCRQQANYLKAKQRRKERQKLNLSGGTYHGKP